MALTGKATKFYDVTATRNVTVTGDLSVGDDVTITGDLAVTGSTTLSTTLTKASVRPNLRRQLFIVAPPISTLADGATYKMTVAPGRAGTVTQISVCANVAPAGGTNTVTFLKNGATALTAATFDPTSLTANVASKPALHGTAANLVLTATDTILVTWTAGTQTTDGQGASICIEVEFDDY